MKQDLSYALWKYVFISFRYPTTHGDTFNAAIFMDGACSTVADVNHLENAIVLNLRRHVVWDICADEHPDCHNLKMNQCDDNTTRVCKGKVR